MMLDLLPLWGLFLATTAIVLLAVEAGYRFGRFQLQRKSSEKDGPVGSMVGATLALLAFLLTFTFSLAAARYETRRVAVLDESNAIGTTYLRAGLLPEPQRTAIRRLLHEYVEERVTGVQRLEVQAAIARSEAIHARLWSQAAELAASDPRSIVTGLFLQSLNEMIDMHARRVAAGLRSRIPDAIWTVLFIVTLLSMGVTGYQEGLSGASRTPAVLALVLAFSGVIVLIAALDRPHEGLLSISQQSLIDVEKSMTEPIP